MGVCCTVSLRESHRREENLTDVHFDLCTVDDAVRDVIPFWPIPEVPASAHRLIDLAALEDIHFEPCSMTDCWFTASDDDKNAAGALDMRELDLSHLKTFLNGMTVAEDDWKVCELVDMFDEWAEGSEGKGWSCMQVSMAGRSGGPLRIIRTHAVVLIGQIGRQIAQLLDERPPTQQQQASGSGSAHPATIVNAPRIKSKDTLPGHTVPIRSEEVRQQIKELNAVQGGKKKRTARDNAVGPPPDIITDPPRVRP